MFSESQIAIGLALGVAFVIVVTYAVAKPARLQAWLGALIGGAAITGSGFLRVNVSPAVDAVMWLLLSLPFPVALLANIVAWALVLYPGLAWVKHGPA
jgi:hypothetical protein